jgi:hypothetical protein
MKANAKGKHKMNDTAESFELTPAGVETLPVANDPMSILASALERGIDTEQLSKLMDLQERYEANEARKSFFAAMVKFQAQCPAIKKTGKEAKGRYTYPELDEVMRTIKPHMDECGLAVRFDTEMTGEMVITATCYVMHRDGHTQSNQFAAPIDQTKSAAGNYIMNATQQVASARSYAKRYALFDGLNLVGTNFDDDGQCLDDRYEKHDKVVAARQPQDPITSEQIAQLKLHAERLRKEVDDGKPVKRILNQVVFYVDSTAKLTKRDTADILQRLDSEAE